MFNKIKENTLTNILVVGDKVLIRPINPKDKSKSGLYLPATITEKEEVQTGFIVKVGPGYPLPSMADDDIWNQNSEKVKYMPLQAEEGDKAIYLQRHAIEIMYQNEKFIIIPQSAILLLERADNY